MSALHSIALGICLLLAAVFGVHAQTPAAPPSGITQQQFDALVDAISKSVAEKLKADGIAAPPKAAAKPSAAEGADASALSLRAGEAAAIPTLGRQFATIPDCSRERAASSIACLLGLGLVGVAAVRAEEMLRRGLGRLRVALAAGALPEQGLRSIAHLVLLGLLDGIGVFAVWLVCHAAVGLWFSGDTSQDKLAVAVLTGIFGWRLYVLLFRILLRPGLPGARPATCRMAMRARCTFGFRCSCSWSSSCASCSAYFRRRYATTGAGRLPGEHLAGAFAASSPGCGGAARATRRASGSVASAESPRWPA